MMKKIAAVFCMAVPFCIVLSGCAPQYQTTYSYKAPNTWRGRMCANRCLNVRSTCAASCRAQNASCRTDANLTAMPQYLNYVEQQNKKNQPIINSVSDYADYSNCTSYCGCASRDCF